MTITEKMKTITPEEFGFRIAKAFNASKSSTTIFFIQQALSDCEDDNGIYWDMFQEMLDRFESEAKARAI